MSKNRRENKQQDPVKSSNRETQPRTSQSQKQEQPKEAANSTDDVFSKRVIAIATLLGAITAFIVSVIFALPKPNIFFPATPTPITFGSTATSISYARIQSLSIMKDGSLIESVNPGGSIVLTKGWNVDIRVNFISNTNDNDLTFSWEFCHQEYNFVGQGAVKTPYTLSVEGVDCIGVTILKGGKILDNSKFPVTVNINQP